MHPRQQFRRCCAAFLATLWATTALAGAEPPPAPPVIPVAQAKPATPATEALENGSITLEPGINQVIPVSAGHLNRIITPFANPKVRTTADGLTTEVSGSVIYVAPPADRPETLFVTDGEEEGRALSLTLMPKAIAPREVRVGLAGGHGGDAGASRAAATWERSHPYQDTIKALLRELALGRIPPGYAMGDGAPGAPPACWQEGLSFSFAQQVLGHSLWVAIGVVANQADRTVEFFDDACMRERRVAAVAAWPEVLLEPGARSEVYVVMRRDDPDPGDSRPARPSLLGTAAGAAVSAAPQSDKPDAAGAGGPWALQVAALQSERGARELVAQLRAKGYPAAAYQGRDGMQYVRVGGYPSREDAIDALAGIRALGHDPLVVTGQAP
jgi:conjugal transfer pilus assembly protein TraK